MVSNNFPEAFPDAMKLVEQMQLTNDAQNALILEVDQNGRDVEEVVSEWMAANKSTWRPWVDAAKN
ncbi:MAG: hypothetical protein GDA36_00150 [Rhodobacteraceae bacterium]|nr:hypothetical protein [Paracoccaceae bacterium]